MQNIPEFHTKRTVCTVARAEHTSLLFSYYTENRSHLAPWEPLRDPDYYTKKGIEKRLTEEYDRFLSERAVIPFIALHKKSGEVAGLCTFSNIIRGPFQACYLGYSVAKKFEGKGLMHEILGSAVDYIFTEQKLHRIMANYVPTNIRSEALLERLGFKKEGYARSYLKIAGEWEDHILTSLLAEEWFTNKT